MIQTVPQVPVSEVADVVRVAVAPVFLLSGIGAFLNVCASRLSRIVDRSRVIEPLLLASRGQEHERWVVELRIVDRRMQLVNIATGLSVLSAVLTCLVVILLFAASLLHSHFGTVIALLFIASMLAIGIAFAIFLAETRLAERAVRVRSELLQHKVDSEN
ncbi:MAG: DUF2721 domain-containing protein [Pseudomonadota bacterium]